MSAGHSGRFGQVRVHQVPQIPQLKRGGQLANLPEFGETFPPPACVGFCWYPVVRSTKDGSQDASLWPDQPGFSSLVSHQLASVPRTHRRSPLARFGPNRARTGREVGHTHGTRWRVLGRSGRGSRTSTGRRSSSLGRYRRPASISPLLAQRSLHLCSSAKKTITTSSKRRLSLPKRARPRRKTGPGPSAVRRVGAGPPGSVPTHF